jgi:hypothetical protein
VFHKHVALIKEGQETPKGSTQETPKGSTQETPQGTTPTPTPDNWDIKMKQIKDAYVKDLRNSIGDTQKMVDAFFRHRLARAVWGIEYMITVMGKEAADAYRKAARNYFGDNIKSVDDVYNNGLSKDATTAIKNMKDRIRYYYKIEFSDRSLNDNLNLDLLLNFLKKNDPLTPPELHWIKNLVNKAFDRDPNDPSCGLNIVGGINPTEYFLENAYNYVDPMVDQLNEIKNRKDYLKIIKGDTRYKSLTDFMAKLDYLVTYFRRNIEIDYFTLMSKCPAWPPSPSKAPSKAPSKTKK